MVFFSGCFEPLKETQISNFNEIWLKKWENLFWIVNFSFIWWATLPNNSSCEPHGTYVSGLTFLLHQEGPKNHNQFFTFVRGVELTSWCLPRPWYRLLTNFLCLPDSLICLSRIDQAERFAWFAWAGLIRLGRGTWFAWAGLIRLGRGARFAWAGLIRLRRLPHLHKQDFLSCSENQAIRQTT